MSWKQNLLCLPFQQKFICVLRSWIELLAKTTLIWVGVWMDDLTNLKVGLMTEEKPRHAAWHG